MTNERRVIGGHKTSAQLGVTPSGASKLNPDNDKSAINLKEKVSAKQTWDCLGYGWSQSWSGEWSYPPHSLSWWWWCTSEGLLVSNSDRQSGGIQLSEVQCPICLRQHATSSGGYIRTEKIGQEYFCEGWKGLAMGQSILTHCGSWRFQVPTGKG